MPDRRLDQRVGDLRLGAGDHHPVGVVGDLGRRDLLGEEGDRVAGLGVQHDRVGPELVVERGQQQLPQQGLGVLPPRLVQEQGHLEQHQTASGATDGRGVRAAVGDLDPQPVAHQRERRVDERAGMHECVGDGLVDQQLRGLDEVLAAGLEQLVRIICRASRTLDGRGGNRRRPASCSAPLIVPMPGSTRLRSRGHAR